jgi:hypothetical protein
MANALYEPVQARARELKILTGVFTADSSNELINDGRTADMTIVKEATGFYTATLHAKYPMKDYFPALVGASLTHYSEDNQVPYVFQIEDDSRLGSAGEISFNVFKIDTGAFVQANVAENDRVFITFLVLNSAV